MKRQIRKSVAQQIVETDGQYDPANLSLVERSIYQAFDRIGAKLYTFSGCGMSLKVTSDALFMHKNTLQYQLDRIWRNSGYDPRAFQDAVILYLGVKLLL